MSDNCGLQDLNIQVPPIDKEAVETVSERQESLTKPPGSLGRLEEFSARIAGIKSDVEPKIDEKVVVTMAGDHGVTAENVSAYPSDVTAEMVKNMADGGAAVNALAQANKAREIIVDMGVDADIDNDRIVDSKIGYGTGNIAEGPAMSQEEAVKAVEAGRKVFREHGSEADLVGLGDMGIGNTTSSAAITSVISGEDVEDVVGRGTGIDDIEKKIDVVERSLEVNKLRSEYKDDSENNPTEVLASLGGYEIAGLVGVILEAASRRKPVVVDGFITGASALIATEIETRTSDYLLPSHVSTEPGHEVQLDHLGLEPLFDLGMGLGEGTGACLAFSVYKSACSSLNRMNTFEEMGINE